MGKVVDGKYVADDGTVVEPAGKETKRSMGAEIGAKIGKAVPHIKDATKKTLGFVADVGESVAKGAVKGVGGTFDLLGDAAAFATDFTTNVATGGKGTDLGSKEGWIDRGNKRMGEMLDKNKIVDSELGKTDLGKGVLKIAEFGGEFVSPGGAVAKGAQGIAKLNKIRVAAKQAPAFKKEVDALRTVLVKEGRAPTDDEIRAIAEKYSKNPKALDEMMGGLRSKFNSAKNDLSSVDDKFHAEYNQKVDKFREEASKLLGKDIKYVGDVAGLKKSDLNKLDKIAKDLGIDNPARSVTSSGRYDSGFESAIGGKKEVMNSASSEMMKQAEIDKLLRKFEPEEVASWGTKHPKLAKAIKRLGAGGLGILVGLNNGRYTPEQVEAELEDIEREGGDGSLPSLDINVSSEPTEFSIKSADGKITYFADKQSRERVQNARRRMNQLASEGLRGVDKRAENDKEGMSL